MYTEALLREAFGDMEILRLAAYDRVIEEGTAHSGMSALIDLVAKKRKQPIGHAWEKFVMDAFVEFLSR